MTSRKKMKHNAATAAPNQDSVARRIDQNDNKFEDLLQQAAIYDLDEFDDRCPKMYSDQQVNKTIGQVITDLVTNWKIEIDNDKKPLYKEDTRISNLRLGMQSGQIFFGAIATLAPFTKSLFHKLACLIGVFAFATIGLIGFLIETSSFEKLAVAVKQNAELRSSSSSSSSSSKASDKGALAIWVDVSGIRREVRVELSDYTFEVKDRLKALMVNVKYMIGNLNWRKIPTECLYSWRRQDYGFGRYFFLWIMRVIKGGKSDWVIRSRGRFADCNDPETLPEYQWLNNDGLPADDDDPKKLANDVISMIPFFGYRNAMSFGTSNHSKKKSLQMLAPVNRYFDTEGKVMVQILSDDLKQLVQDYYKHRDL